MKLLLHARGAAAHRAQKSESKSRKESREDGPQRLFPLLLVASSLVPLLLVASSLELQEVLVVFDVAERCVRQRPCVDELVPRVLAPVSLQSKRKELQGPPSVEAMVLTPGAVAEEAALVVGEVAPMSGVVA
ncbi:hypothetical protein AK812_SmicGene48121 [Symbiodinium microadriaticum]|uniref:Uncharacterized protein n=1 Tax=Symbiodinium microadriaticum TaxID=2951 RepID=A0A1Q9BQB3_SYMMI|nr:hypothetical protein AK812_SmicGene48121 [Symbiodinium microadriaticum]